MSVKSLLFAHILLLLLNIILSQTESGFHSCPLFTYPTNWATQTASQRAQARASKIKTFLNSQTGLSASSSLDTSYPLFSTSSPSTATAQCSLYFSNIDTTDAAATLRIPIFVKKMSNLEAKKSPKKQIWVVGGAPSDNNPHFLEKLMLDLKENVPESEIFTFDVRGSGRSQPMRCPESEVSNSEDGISLSEEELKQCFIDLDTQNQIWMPFKNMTRYFTTTHAAGDLNKMMKYYNLQAQYYNTSDPEPDEPADIYVYALAYGTVLVSRLMQIQEEEKEQKPKGIIFDSAYNEWGTDKTDISVFDDNMNLIGKQVMDYCRNNTDCSKVFGFSSGSLVDFTAVDVSTLANNDTIYKPSSEVNTLLSNLLLNANAAGSLTKCCAKVKAAHATFDDTAKSPFVCDYSTVKAALGATLFDTLTRNLLPSLIFRFNRCEDNDITVLFNFLSAMYGKEGSYATERNFNSVASTFSFLNYRHIVYNEFWDSNDYTGLKTKYDSELVFGNRVYKYATSKAVFDDQETLDYATTVSYEAKYIKQMPGFQILTESEALFPNSTVTDGILFLHGNLDPIVPYNDAIDLYSDFVASNSPNPYKKFVFVPHAGHQVVYNSPFLSGTKNKDCGREILLNFINVAEGNVSLVDITCRKLTQGLDFFAANYYGPNSLSNADIVTMKKDLLGLDSNVNVFTAKVQTEFTEPQVSLYIFIIAIIIVVIVGLIGLLALCYCVTIYKGMFEKLKREKEAQQQKEILDSKDKQVTLVTVEAP